MRGSWPLALHFFMYSIHPGDSGLEQDSGLQLLESDFGGWMNQPGRRDMDPLGCRGGDDWTLGFGVRMGMSKPIGLLLLWWCFHRQQFFFCFTAEWGRLDNYIIFLVLGSLFLLFIFYFTLVGQVIIILWFIL